MSNHTPVEYFRTNLFSLLKSQFGMMLHDGASLQQVQQLATEVPIIAGAALQKAGIEAMIEAGMVGGMHQVVEPPPAQEQQGEHRHDQGPEDDDPTVTQGNPFDQ